MGNALARAFADADRSYLAAKAAKPAAVFDGPTGPMTSKGVGIAKAGEQMLHCRGWVFVAIRAIANRIAGQSLHVGRIKTKPSKGRKLSLPRHLKSIGDSVEPIEGHELLSLIEAPNPVHVQWSLINSTVQALMLTGRAFWWLPMDGASLWPLPPSWVESDDPMAGTWHIKPKGGLEEFSAGPDEIVPFTLPTPSDPFAAASPLQSQAKAVATDEALQTAQYQSFRNGVHPSVMIRVGRLPGLPATGIAGEVPSLTPLQRREVIDGIRRHHAGTMHHGEPFIVDGSIESIEKISMSPEEMSYLDSGAAVQDRIMEAFGVSPANVGKLENANRASATVAEKTFSDNTVNPICELMSQTLTKFVRRRFTDTQKLVAWIDPARADDRELRLQEWKTARANGDVTPNEFRRTILNLPDIPGGDSLRDQLGNRLN